MTQSGLTFNVDTAYTAFVREQPLLDFILGVLGTDRINDRGLFGDQIKRLNSVLKGMQVATTHRARRVYQIGGVSADPLRYALRESRM